MKLTAQEDVEAPLDRVFAEITNFESIERQALRRGIDVRRTDSVIGPAEGMCWTARFGFRGKSRDADIELLTYLPPEKLVFSAATGGLVTQTAVDLVPLSRGRTRINVTSEFNASTLSARLLLQSLKLAKGGVDKRFRFRMGGFAKELENKLKSPF